MTGAHNIYNCFFSFTTMGRIQLTSASSSAIPVSLRVASNEGGRVSASPHSSPLSSTVQEFPGGCC